MNLEASAMYWLRFEKRCKAVLRERSPRCPYGSRPDVVGIMQSRYVIEVEAKRSMSDFRANGSKIHIRNRVEGHLKRYPRQFYFIVPESLVEKVMPELPGYAGLITPHYASSKVIVKAPLNYEATKLTWKECVRLGECLSNQMIAQSLGVIRWINHEETDWGLEYRI